MLDGLRWKLVVLCTATTGLIATAMAVAILLLAENLIMKQAEAEFSDTFRSVQYALEGQGTVSSRWLSQTESMYGIYLQIEQYGIPLRYMRERQVDETAAAALIAVDKLAREGSIATFPIRIRDPQHGGAYYAGVTNLPGGPASIRLYAVKSLAEVQGELFRLRWGAGMAILAVLCLLGLFSWRFVSHLLRPIEENRQRQAVFIASASHELRTPLAVIRTGIAAIHKAPAEQADHFLHLISREEAHMSRLVEELLVLAGVHSVLPETRLRLETCEVESLLITVYERFERTARSKDVHLGLKLPENILPRCRVDFDRMEQALSVLVDNAICYTPKGGEVEISAVSGQHELTISVRDNGMGISAEHRPYIFDRFYRADAARTDKAHLGLGLSIAKEIVELHRGRIEFREVPSGGSEFLMYLLLI